MSFYSDEQLSMILSTYGSIDYWRDMCDEDIIDHQTHYEEQVKLENWLAIACGASMDFGSQEIVPYLQLQGLA